MKKSTYQEIDWYETPLYYDLVFDQETPGEVDFIETIAHRHGMTRGMRVLEPACGSGRLVLEFARRGYDVTGFDLSPSMLEYAGRRVRQERRKANLHEARMEDFEYDEKFDIAHCLVSTFKYLLTEEDSRAHLQCVADALHSGGIYVLGFHLSDYEDTSRQRERWVVDRDGIKVTCNIQSWPADRRRRQEKVRSRLRVEEKDNHYQAETSWMFRTYNASQFRRLLRQVPDLEHVATYDFCYDSDSPREFNDEQMDNIVILRRI